MVGRYRIACNSPINFIIISWPYATVCIKCCVNVFIIRRFTKIRHTIWDMQYNRCIATTLPSSGSFQGMTWTIWTASTVCLARWSRVSTSSTRSISPSATRTTDPIRLLTLLIIDYAITIILQINYYSLRVSTETRWCFPLKWAHRICQ